MTAEETATVNIGCNVSVAMPSSKAFLFKIVSESNNAAPECGIISVSSPLGKALLGKRVGEEVHYLTQNTERVVKILSIN